MKKSFKILCSIIIGLVVIGLVVTVLYCAYAGPYSMNKETFDISKKEITEDITVMSFNIRYFAYDDFFKKSWFYRAPLVVENVKQEQPDIIGFQEVQPIHEKYLRKHLEGYEFIIAYRTKLEPKEGMLLAYKKDRFTAEKEGMFWVSETPDRMSKDWGSNSYRVAAYAKLLDKKTNRYISPIDTHLDNVSEEAREKGIKVLIDQVNSLELENAILMGDMNDFDDTLMYKYATSHGYNDALIIADKSYVGSGATYQAYGKKLNGKRIDYFFLDPDFHVKDYHVVDKIYDGVYPSDHFPLTIIINMT